MTPAVLLLLAMRLPCWPFEVEGAGTPDADAHHDVNVESGPATPATTTAPTSTAPTTPPVAPGPSPAIAAELAIPLPVSLPLREESRYDVQYGILGSVGEVRFSAGPVSTGTDGGAVVRLHGVGGGRVLGLGGIERRIDTEFDPRALGSKRWTTLRSTPGRPGEPEITDTASRDRNGVLVLERRKVGAPNTQQAVAFTAPTSDPLGVLWRLRTAPPALGHILVLQLLDGLALWRVRITTTAIGAAPPDSEMPAIRLEGDVEPIFYDGRPDPDRPSRRFTLWLSARTGHLPLRLEVPFGPSDVVMSLAEARRVEGVTVDPTDGGAGAGPAAPRIDAHVAM